MANGRFGIGALGTIWQRVYGSFWFLPIAMLIAALGLALATVALDKRIDAELVGEFWFVFDVGSEGARGVLSAIAGSMITVTGTVFSITIIVLQLASQQYTPRVLRSFTKNRFNHVVLAVLIATFTYALLVLRTVRASDGDVQAFVPSISLSVAVVLALVSIVLLVVFINSVAHNVRASTIITHVSDDVKAVIADLFPEPIGEPAPDEPDPRQATPVGRATVVAAEIGGYLEVVDEETLFSLAEEGHFVVRMECLIGDFLLPGEPLATVWPTGEAADGLDERMRGRVRRAFVVGHEKTLQQDVERGLVELVDIAVRALSPSLNDPTTAILAIDRLAELLAQLGTRRFPPRVRPGADHRVRFVARRHEYDELVRLAFDQIRHHGRGNPIILERLAEVIGRIGAQVPAARRAPLRDELDRIGLTADEHLPDEQSREPVRRAISRAHSRIAADETGHASSSR